LKRRTAIKVVLLGALAPRLKLSGAPVPHLFTDAAWVPGDYQPQFFTGAELSLVDQLCEMIIPADAHSPGAHAAQVSLFADLMVSTSDEGVKNQWRAGLRLMQEHAERSSPAEALAEAGAHEDNPATDLERFFSALKVITVEGYYTSAIGIHQDLEYAGNDYLSTFPGCTHPEHQA
jgi:gluconate 2-dehydrogenase gamma chain